MYDVLLAGMPLVAFRHLSLLHGRFRLTTEKELEEDLETLDGIA